MATSGEGSGGNKCRLVPFTLYTFSWILYKSNAFKYCLCIQHSKAKQIKKIKPVGLSIANREQEPPAHYQLDSTEQILWALCHVLFFSHWVMSDSLATPWTVACQSLLSMEFSRQEYWCVCLEYWSGLPLPSPGCLPDPVTEPHLLHWQADSLPLSHQEDCQQTRQTDKHYTVL